MSENPGLRKQHFYPQKRSKSIEELHNVKFPMRMKLINKTTDKTTARKNGMVLRMFHDFLEKRGF